MQVLRIELGGSLDLGLVMWLWTIARGCLFCDQEADTGVSGTAHVRARRICTPCALITSAFSGGMSCRPE